MHILAMDDAKLIQKVLKVLVGNLTDATLDVANNVEELLAFVKTKAAQNISYDLILSDLNCPGLPQDPDTEEMGGLQVVALMRRDPRNARLRPFYSNVPMSYRNTPILIFTTETDEDLQHQAKGAGDPRMGATDLLIKSHYLSAEKQDAFLDIIKKVTQPTATG